MKPSIIAALAASALALSLLGGCAPGADSTSVSAAFAPQLRAIEQIRGNLELPQLPLTFVERTTMANAPSIGQPVDVFQDGAGRKYSVDPVTDQVVEIDARALLPRHGATPPGMQELTEFALRAKAMQYVTATIPDFDALQSAWTYEEGVKGDNHFYSWYAPMPAGGMNRPFAQIGLHSSGLLFAYYNTLSMRK